MMQIHYILSRYVLKLWTLVIEENYRTLSGIQTQDLKMYIYLHSHIIYVKIKYAFVSYANTRFIRLINRRVLNNWRRRHPRQFWNEGSGPCPKVGE